jgi:hypothetical protein
MGLANYTELQASVAAFLNKTNLTAQIPDFIALAEAIMRREITSIGHIDTWADVEIDENGFQLPCRADEVASVSADGRAVGFVSPDRFTTVGTGHPYSYTIDGGVLRVNPAGTVTIRMQSGLCGLSSSVKVNWILRDHPDAYLYGALMQAAPFLRDDERIPVWGSMFRSAIDSINKREARRQTGGNVRIQAGPTP